MSDKLKDVKRIRYEPFFGGDTLFMSIDEAKDQFGCMIEALQGYCADGAVFAMDENDEDIFINWD